LFEMGTGAKGRQVWSFGAKLSSPRSLPLY
jgi:hypothetical protein